MNDDYIPDFTVILNRLVSGSDIHDQGDALIGAVYKELQKLAAGFMKNERVDHTLQPTALVNEVYMRLARDQDMQWRDRRHFFGAAVESMRRILVDHARMVRAQKRAGDRARLNVSLSGLLHEDDPDLVLALDEALDRLAEEDARTAEGAKLRLYAGFSTEDVASAMDLTPRTVQRDWAYARARLTEFLGSSA